MGKYEQDKENADFSKGTYTDVRDQEKTQVRRCIAMYIPISLVPSKMVTVKMGRVRQITANIGVFPTGVYLA